MILINCFLNLNNKSVTQLKKSIIKKLPTHEKLRNKRVQS